MYLFEKLDFGLLNCPKWMCDYQPILLVFSSFFFFCYACQNEQEEVHTSLSYEDIWYYTNLMFFICTVYAECTEWLVKYLI